MLLKSQADQLYRSQGATIPVSDGGTGANNKIDALDNLDGIMHISVSGINARTAGLVTPLFTVPAGKSFVMMGHSSICTSATGAGNGWSVSIGTNATTYNMMTNTAMTTLDTTNEIFRAAITGIGQLATAGQVINMRTNTAATTTTMTCTATITGYLI